MTVTIVPAAKVPVSDVPLVEIEIPDDDAEKITTVGEAIEYLKKNAKEE